jgi:REP element-mobilizing transposase RayT
MPRKLRLEYPGAIYHVMNRGNYRRPIFADEKTKVAFVACVFEACEKSNWILHAYAAMINHYHLALETPDGNLVRGMQWLQGTFANRFNRFRKEHGHLFQGRYKAILTEEGKSLGEVCDYIHLNPVNARLLPLDRLTEYRHCSYWYLRNPSERPAFLRPETALECAAGIPDTPEGWLEYDRHLEAVAEIAAQGPRGSERRHRNFCRGWAVGSDEFKASLVKEYNLAGTIRSWDSLGVADVRRLRWEAALARALKVLGRGEKEARAEAKSARWKLAVAAWMRGHTQAGHRWLSLKLNLGAPAALSRNLTSYRRSHQVSDPSWRRLTSKYAS